MGDESRIYNYHPKTKQQSSQWKIPQSPRANMNKCLSSMQLRKVQTGFSSEAFM
jgi:hypothetical protein